MTLGFHVKLTPMVINAPYDLSGEPGFKSLAGEGSGANSEVVLY